MRNVPELIDPPEFDSDKEYEEFINNLFNQENMKECASYLSDEIESEKAKITKNSKSWGSVLIDINKFSLKKFSNIPEIPFDHIKEFAFIQSADEGNLISYNEIEYYGMKYAQINNIIPNGYRFLNISMDRFIAELFEKYKVPEYAYTKMNFHSNEENSLTSFFICFTKTLLMHINGEDRGIIYYNPEDEKNENSFFYTLMGLLKGYIIPKIIKNKIYIIYRDQQGFNKIGFDVNKIKIKLDENYNDGFIKKSEEIIKGLNNKNKTHLVILNGVPGTGKTSYVRYLTSKLKKNIIFISPDMVDSITDPAFIPFLMKNNDSILIIEDAEPVLEKRGNGGRSSAVSNVLNLTDGLLSDCLKISIVATFNTDKKTIDDALLRKGRLLMNYKFEKLCVEKSKALLKKLGYKNAQVKEPMTLADIYYYGTDNNVNNSNERKIGFNGKVILNEKEECDTLKTSLGNLNRSKSIYINNK
jgi:hypothetical protein